MALLEHAPIGRSIFSTASRSRRSRHDGTITVSNSWWCQKGCDGRFLQSKVLYSVQTADIYRSSSRAPRGGPSARSARNTVFRKFTGASPCADPRRNSVVCCRHLGMEGSILVDDRATDGTWFRRGEQQNPAPRSKGCCGRLSPHGNNIIAILVQPCWPTDNLARLQNVPKQSHITPPAPPPCGRFHLPRGTASRILRALPRRT